MTMVLVWEAISGGVMVAGGVVLAASRLARHRRFGQWDRGDKVNRIAGIIFGVLLSLFGTYFLNLARQGYVAEKGGRVVQYH